MARFDPVPPSITVHPVAHAATDLLALDHVALAVSDRDAMAAFLCDHLGMHELHRTAESTLVAAEARAAKLALVAADGPTEPGALARLVLRVADFEGALASLPAPLQADESGPDIAAFDGPEGLGLALTPLAGGGIDYDLDRVVLRVSDPEEATIALAEWGFVPRGGALHVADKRVSFERGDGAAQRSLLDRIAVLVTSVDAVAAQARQRNVDIEEDPEDSSSFSIVLPGPERIRLTFVEQAPAA